LLRRIAGSRPHGTDTLRRSRRNGSCITLSAAGLPNFRWS